MCYLKFKTYAEVLTDFCAKEVIALTKKDTCLDIFRDTDLFRDEFERLNHTMANFASYKFIRTRKERTYDRLDIISRTGFLHGPQYIICLLQKYKLQKEIFTLILEQGREAAIPPILS